MPTPIVEGCGAVTRIGRHTKIGRQTQVTVSPNPRTGRLWLTLQHAATAVTVLLTPDQAAAIRAALPAPAPGGTTPCVPA